MFIEPVANVLVLRQEDHVFSNSMRYQFYEDIIAPDLHGPPDGGPILHPPCVGGETTGWLTRRDRASSCSTLWHREVAGVDGARVLLAIQSSLHPHKVGGGGARGRV